MVSLAARSHACRIAVKITVRQNGRVKWNLGTIRRFCEPESTRRTRLFARVYPDDDDDGGGISRFRRAAGGDHFHGRYAHEKSVTP